MAKVIKEITTKAPAKAVELTTAQTAEMLLNNYFDAKEKADSAKLALETFTTANENELFAKTNKYTVRYGSIEKTVTQAVSFEEGFKLSFDALVKAQKSPKVGKYIKGTFSKTAIENIIEKSKLLKAIETLDRDDDADAAVLDTIETMLGVNGFSTKESYSFKKINFEE